MLSVTRYNPGRYPPGPRFPQFGGNQLGGAVSATEEARGKLAAKRQRMAQFHTDRLEHDGFMPMHRPGHTPEDVFMAPPDAEEPTMHAASGHPPPPPPAGRTTRDTGTDPDRPDADEMDVDLRGDYPPQPPQPRMKETGTDPIWKKSASSLGVVLPRHRHKGNTWGPTRNSLDQTPAHRHPFSHPQTTDTARDGVDHGAPPRRRHPLTTDHLLRLREVEASWRQCTAKRRPTTC